MSVSGRETAGLGVGLGVAFGAAVGAALGNVAMGVAFGVIIGATVGTIAQERSGRRREPESRRRSERTLVREQPPTRSAV